MGPEGGTIERLEGAFSTRAALLDRHSDAVHGRTVFTLGGTEADLRASLLSGARSAIDLIDLRRHSGAHPHLGALDVCPVVHLDEADSGRALALAADVAEGLAELGLPVFLYGRMASSDERRERHFFREGGPARMAERMSSGELEPDLGPAEPHPSAGAVLVTARLPLGAFNVEVEGIDLDAARKIASRLRESGGGIEGVRAIAIDLGGGLMQISTNVHDPAKTPLGIVVNEVRRLAAPLGGRAVAGELIGLIPERGLAGYPSEVPIRGPDPRERTIEAKLGLDRRLLD